jgi:hypothetical protein
VQKEKMQILIIIIFSLIVIVAATAIGKRLPSAAGLIGVMPLTGALVLIWVYIVLIAIFAVWLGAAIVHQWMLK